ncbi:DUF1624 domain-containing protein [Pedobacter montanisoli]|uniref:Heparan-alpha-glucosaminide N-acetyltransferase domain-containing protein n=1 Tax=Pedobacter montanisoli TaxID=2923277 RepID=A0ABT0A058_9SPHI|nr:heparan-alpha-glucosaminide N-acetyltransferase domain-containing protein [Pedobacter montanisoli]MCJ0743914.1 heparan-alpha-glucosaminide N-acetyltransferase domain-containing protein [Pedobacter montanisoli]
MKRVVSIDIVRGIVMIIMALDHVRDLMHINSITESPTNLLTTTPALFFTRWITYLCAPVFVFLAGTSVYLSLKEKTISILRKTLITRGLWLIVLEFTIVNFAIFFDIGFHSILFEVIATIGIGFIILGLMLKLSPRQIGILGLIIIFFHNLTPLIPFTETSPFKSILTPLFNLTIIPLLSGKAFIIAYPPIPWLGIMLIGFASGKLFELSAEKRKKVFTQLGLGALILFVIVRFINLYGDSLQWSQQKNGWFTFLSFMNVSKYPPSLVFCLSTLGIMFLLLAFAEQFTNKVKSIAAVYGQVPLFYFIVHFYFIHLLAILMLLLQGFNFSQMEFATGTFGRPRALQSGLPLWAIYIVWISVVVILYKPCLWYAQYKAANKHKQWWLSYL